MLTPLAEPLRASASPVTGAAPGPARFQANPLGLVAFGV